MRKVLLLVNGEPPLPDLLRRRAAEADWFLCTDGALTVALAAGVTPHTVVGDLDSLDRALVPPDVEVAHLAEQDSTDLGKALALAVQRGCDEVLLLGVFGRRLDHGFAALSLLPRYAERLRLRCEDAWGTLTLLRAGEVHDLGPRGATVSLLPLPTAEGVTTTGLRWPLRDATLHLGTADSISNEVAAPPASVSYRAGCLAAYTVE